MYQHNRKLSQCTCNNIGKNSLNSVHDAICEVAKAFRPLDIAEHTVEFGRILAAHHFKRWAEAGNDIAQCPYAIGTPEYNHWRRLEADWFDQRLNIVVQPS